MTTDTDTLVARLRNPPFGAESSERNLMTAAADHIERLRDDLYDAQNGPWPQWASSILNTLKDFGWRFDDLIYLPEELANYLQEYPDSAIEGLQEHVSRLTAQLTEARAGEDELLKGLREIAAITERKENKFPSDWRDQIASCPECQRYKGHPIQNGICDQHRKPIYAQDDHDRRETKILGYRAKDIALAALAAWEAAQ